MKSLFAIGILLFALASSLRAQTNSAAPAPAKAADAAAPDTTSQAAKATQPYPVTAIVVSNTITFPVLLSKNSEPLMTNAVYRRTFGRKVMFASEEQLKGFDVDKLHPSVIAQLDLDPAKAKADQESLDKQNQEWAVQHQQQTQQALSAQAAALAKTQAAAQAAAPAGGTNGAPAGATPRHRKSGTQPPPPPAN